MTPIVTISQCQKALEKMKLANVIRSRARLRPTSLTQLSKKMGMSAGFLHAQLQNPDLRISTLVTLSQHLNYDLLYHYRKDLFLGIGTTPEENELMLENKNLKAEVERLKYENSLLKELMRK